MKIKVFKSNSDIAIQEQVNEFLKHLKPENFVESKLSVSQYSIGGLDIVITIIYKLEDI